MIDDGLVSERTVRQRLDLRIPRTQSNTKTYDGITRYIVISDAIWYNNRKQLRI